MFPCSLIHIVGTKYCCGNMKKIDLKPICCNLCMLWGRCIYSDQHAFVAILSIDKELFFYSTTRIQFRRHECTN